MKTIVIAALLALTIVSSCFAAGDPVSSVRKDAKENAETTTFQRDGKTILKVTLYHPTEPKRKLLRQVVMFKDQAVMELVEFQGKRVFSLRANSRVSVGIQQDLSTGSLESVSLLDASNPGMIHELFEVKDSRLIPVAGKTLDVNRALSKDVGELLEGVVKQKPTSQEFGDRVKGLVKKYTTKESEKQKNSDSAGKE